MKRLLSLIIVISLISTNCCAQNVNSTIIKDSDIYDYKIGLVQFTPRGNGTRGAVEINSVFYEYMIKNATQEGVKLLVFPEQGLIGPPEFIMSDPELLEPFKLFDSSDEKLLDMEHSYPASLVQKLRAHYLTLAEEIPETGTRVCPENGTISETSTVLTRIACLARTANMYIVVNHVEKELCNITKRLTCPKESYYLYNTNVVFNNNGTVVARYRKYNVIDEPWFDVTSKPEVSTFRLDSNYHFGLLIGTDVLSATATKHYYRNKDVGRVILTTRPIDLPFFLSVQDYDTWAYEADVTLIVAGYCRDGVGGIFQGRTTHVTEYTYADHRDRLLYLELPKKFDRPSLLEKPLGNYNIKQFSSKAADMYGPKWYFHDLLGDIIQKRDSDDLNEQVQFRLLTQSYYSETLCLPDGFCCHLTARISRPKLKSYYIFRIGTLMYKFVVAKHSFKTLNDSIITVDLCGVVVCEYKRLDEWICAENPEETPYKNKRIAFDTLVLTQHVNRENNSFHTPSAATANKVMVHEHDYTFFHSGDKEERSLLIMHLNQATDNITYFGIVGHSVNASIKPLNNEDVSNDEKGIWDWIKEIFYIGVIGGLLASPCILCGIYFVCYYGKGNGSHAGSTSGINRSVFYDGEKVTGICPNAYNPVGNKSEVQRQQRRPSPSESPCPSTTEPITVRADCHVSDEQESKASASDVSTRKSVTSTPKHKNVKYQYKNVPFEDDDPDAIYPL